MMPASPHSPIHLLTPGQSLLEAVVEKLLTQASGRDFSGHVVVLPSHRLQVHCKALLSQKLGAFFSPTFCNFADFLAEFGSLPDFSSPPARLSGLQVEWLLRDLIRKRRHQTSDAATSVYPYHAHELSQLLKEATEQGWSGHQILDQLQSALDEDHYISPAAAAALGERLGFLHKICQDFQNSLHSTTSQTAEQHQGACADRLQRRLQKGDVPWLSLQLAGFTSLAPQFHGLWGELVGDARTTVWLSDPKSYAVADDSGLTQLVRHSQKVAELHPQDNNRQGASAHCQPLASAQLHSFADPESEIQGILQLIQQSHDDGCPLNDIALLVPSESRYSLILNLALKKWGLPYNNATARSFQDCAVGKLVMSTLRIFREPASTNALLSWLRHPYAYTWIQKQLPQDQRQGKLAVWLSGLVADICQTGESAGMVACQALCDKLRSPAHGAALQKVRALFQPTLEHSEPECPKVWLDLWEDVLEGLGLTNAHHQRDVDPDPHHRAENIAAWQGLTAQRQELQTALQDHGPLSRGDFFQLLEAGFRTIEIRTTGEPLVGVQILTEREARYVPFREIYICGVFDGSYPKALPADDLIDDYLKRRAGLPGWRGLETIQDTTFQLLRHHCRKLHLCFPRQVGDEPVAPSRFVEQEKYRGAAVHYHQWQEPVDGSSQPDEDTAAGLEGDTTVADRRELIHRLSATALEKLLSCPYRFLLDRLGIKELILPDPNHPLFLGSWLHKVFELYVQRLQQQPEPLAASTSDIFCDQQLSELNQLMETHAPRNFPSSRTGLQLQTVGFPAWLKHLYETFHHHWPITASAPEQPVKLALPLAKNRQIGLHGICDRIDRRPHPDGSLREYFITDYKIRAGASNQDIQSGLAPQLLVYAEAMRQHQPVSSADPPPAPFPRGAVGYWSILKGKMQLAALDNELKTTYQERGLLSTRSRPVILTDALEALRQKISKRVNEHFWRGDRFFANADRCGHCRLAGICRRDDPVHKERIADQTESHSWDFRRDLTAAEGEEEA